MKRLLLSITVSIMVCLSSSVIFAAYTVNFLHVSHRQYEDGSDFNRAVFSVFEDGNYVLTDIVESVELYHPDGSSVTHTGNEFKPSKVLYGRYNANSWEPNEGAWVFDSGFSTESYYSFGFTEPLQTGTYRLEVLLHGESGPHIHTKDFNGLASLPIISSNSFRGYEDSSGNLILTWEAPQDVGFATSGLSTANRVVIEILKSGQYVGELYVRQPTHMGILMVPSSVMQILKAEGDTLRVQLHVRTNDNNNRAYSNPIRIDNLKRERTKVVVIPLGD